MKKAKVILLICILLIAVCIACGGKTDIATEKYASYMLKNNATAKLYDGLSQKLCELDTNKIVSQDKSGDITILTVNSDAINNTMLKLTQSANEILSMRDFCVIKMPIGSISGIRLLSGLGPEIIIKSIPVGSAVGDMKSNMISAGINQVNHRITVTINACVALLYPFDGCVCDISVELLLCETVIIGSVPEVAFG